MATKNPIKKHKWLILISAVMVVVIVAATLLQNALAASMMKNTEVSRTSIAFREQNYDSADPGRFTLLNPVGDNYEKAAETHELMLFVRNDCRAIKLYNKQTQETWDSVVSEEDVTAQGIGEYYANRMMSLFTFDYIDLSNLNVEEESITLYECDPVITTEKIKNGIRIHYQFEDLAVGVSLDFCLVGDELHCLLADQFIRENTAMIDRVEELKDKIQSKIKAFQASTDTFQGQVEGEDMDASEKDMIRIYIGEIYKLLVNIKETTGTRKFDPMDLETIQEDIDVMAMLLEGRGEIEKGITEMREKVAEIIEDTDFLQKNQVTGITNFRLMPYFGSGTAQDQGYVFYPDKNGAISYFDVPHPDSGGSFERDVYDKFSPTPLRSSKIKGKDETESRYKNACLYPVFGVKKGQSAVAAVITRGEQDSAITFNPITSASKRTGAFATFHMRKKTVYMNDGGGTSEHYDKQRTAQDWGMVYKVLNGDKAGYAGMAGAYRDMLLENGLLKKSDWMEGDMPLASSFFMGVLSGQDSLSRNYINFTRFEDVTGFLEQMHKNGIRKNLVNIEYWTGSAGKNSYDVLKPAGELGGKSALAQLAAFAKPGETLLSMEKYSLCGQRGDLGFTVGSSATVKSLNSLAVEYYGWNLLNPHYVYNHHMKNLSRLEKLGTNGITYTDLADHLYYDYNAKGAVDKADTAAILKKMMQDSKDKVPYAVVPHATSLYFDTADWIPSVADRGSGYMFTDEAVPFYQMVIHGYIPYSSEALNEVADTAYSKLKRMEFGEIPFYALTEKLPPEKKSEYISGLYSSEIDKWSEAVIADYKEYSQACGDSWKQVMVNHEKLQDNVYRTTFADGSAVTVNYNEEAVTVNGTEIAAMGYVWTEAQK